MGADYQLLVGQHFESNGVPYVVREVVWFENRWIAKADPEHVDDSRPREQQTRSFPWRSQSESTGEMDDFFAPQGL